MRIIAFDTALERCSVAILDGEKLLAALSEDMQRGQAEALLPMIALAVEAAGINLEDLQRIAVTTGPGSFTGVRIGVAAARGLALALGLGVVPATTLQAIAAQWQYMAGGRSCVVVQNARRGAVYWQSFEAVDAQGWPKAPSAPEITSIETARGRINKDTVLLGNGARLVALMPEQIPAHEETVDAVTLARLGISAHPIDAAKLLPFYLRPPDAKLPQASPLAP